MSLKVCSLGMVGNPESLKARVTATLDFYGFPPDFDVDVTPDVVTPVDHVSWVSSEDLQGLVGQVQLEFISNVVPWASCKVTLPAHTVEVWADDFQRGSQWELLTVKQLG